MITNVCYTQNKGLDQSLHDLFIDFEIEPNSDLYENLLQVYNDPIDLNDSHIQDWSKLFFLSQNEILGLHKYCQDNYPILSVYELQGIAFMDESLFKRIKPFVNTGKMKQSKSSFSERIKSADNHYLMMRFQYQPEINRGFAEKQYTGPKFKEQFRYRFQEYGKFSFGINMERDIGEAYDFNLNKKTFLYDHSGFYFMLEEQNALNRIIIGDYSIQNGQGLCFSNNFSFGAGASPILSAKRMNLGINPYGSFVENNFLRGTAFDIDFGKFNSLIFISRKSIDATVVNGKINSIKSSGLHRTESEIGSKSSSAENIFGSRLSYHLLNGTVSIIYAYRNYDHPKWNENSTVYYNFDKSREIQNTSISYDFYLSNLNFFGESAFNSSLTSAHSHGILFPLSKNLDLTAVYRNFGQEYQSIKGNAYSAKSGINNEEGCFIGLAYNFKRKSRLTAIVDYYKRKAPSYQYSTPYFGNKYRLRLDHSLNKSLSMTMQYRNSINIRETPLERDFNPSIERHKNQYVLQLKIKPYKSLDFETRYIRNTVSMELKTRGSALSQDFNIELRKFSFKGRIAIFETDEFNNAVYLLERDVLYSFTAPALYGSGIRYYVLSKIKVFKSTDIWLRLAATKRYDVKTLGSGLEEISGNFKSEIKLQIKLRI